MLAHLKIHGGQYQDCSNANTEYGSNSGESAKKEVKVRRKDKISEYTLKSKSERRRKSES